MQFEEEKMEEKTRTQEKKFLWRKCTIDQLREEAKQKRTHAHTPSNTA